MLEQHAKLLQKQRDQTSAYWKLIAARGVIKLSRREVRAPTNKKRKANDPASKKGRTTVVAMSWNLLNKYLPISKPMISDIDILL